MQCKEELKKIIGSLEFLDLYLVDTQLYRGVDGAEEDFPETFKQQRKIHIKASTMESEDGEDEKVRIFITFGIRYIDDESVKPEYFMLENRPPSEKDDEFVLAELISTFCVEYHVKSEIDIDADAFDTFCKENAVHNVWSFWREHAFNTCLKSRIPKFTIPFFKVSTE